MPFVLLWTREHDDQTPVSWSWHKKNLLITQENTKKTHNDFVFCSVLDHSQYHGQLSVVLPLWWPVGDHLCMDVWYRSVWAVHHVHHVPYSVLEEKSSQVSHNGAYRYHFKKLWWLLIHCFKRFPSSIVF